MWSTLADVNDGAFDVRYAAAVLSKVFPSMTSALF